jgi:uncharacterized protein (TIGR04255 family)
LTHLPNAPLIYTLAIVRFPAVPSMDRFLPAFHDALRMKYPHLDSLTLQQMRVDFVSGGPKVEQVSQVIWQLASPDRKIAIVLSSETLAIHTISYKDHSTFIEEFINIISKLISVENIGIAWINATALRYINLVVTEKGEGLDKLLQLSVLPPPFSDVENLNLIESIHISRYRTPKADVRFQILRNPATILPTDLHTPLVQLNNWNFDRASTEFAVIDTDCSIAFVAPIPMDVDAVRTQMYDLRFVAKSIFLKVGTEYAEKLWKGNT